MKYVREPLPGYGNGYYIFTNEGQSKRDIVTLSAANIAPIEIWGVKNDFEGSLSFTKQSRSFTDYEDYEMNDDVSYNGKTIKKANYRSLITMCLLPLNFATRLNLAALAFQIS